MIWKERRIMANITSQTVYDTEKTKNKAIYEIKQVLKYRFLIQNLVSRDLKVRYKRSALGFIWVMLNPLLTMLITVYVFSQILKVNIVDFPTYALSGLLMFNLFAQGTVAAMSNLTGNGTILSRIYIPPSVFVFSSIGSALVNMFYALVPLVIITIGIDHIFPKVGWVLSVIPIAEMTVFAAGMGLIVSALMVYFRDTFEIYNVLVALLNMATPLFYPYSILSPQLKAIELYNPLYLLIDTFRSILLRGVLPGHREIFLDFVFSFGTFIIGWLIFTRMEKNFAYQF